MKPIFDYDNYRLYLSDELEERKSRNPKFSLRGWAKMLDLSPASLTRIIQGTRNISSATALRLAQQCRMTKKATEYFELLVAYNQAHTHEEKKHYFERMLSHKSSASRKIQADQYEFYAKWYYSAVRELLNFMPFDGNWQKASRQLLPPVKPAEVEAAINLLLRLGLANKRSDGSYEATESLISTGYDTHAVAIDNFQIEMMDQARKAINTIPRNLRQFSTLTLSISHEQYKDIIEELRAFRRRVLDMAKQAGKPGRIYQFNFHVFPLSQEITSEDQS